MAGTGFGSRYPGHAASAKCSTSGDLRVSVASRAGRRCLAVRIPDAVLFLTIPKGWALALIERRRAWAASLTGRLVGQDGRREAVILLGNFAIRKWSWRQAESLVAPPPSQGNSGDAILPSKDCRPCRRSWKDLWEGASGGDCRTSGPSNPRESTETAQRRWSINGIDTDQFRPVFQGSPVGRSRRRAPYRIRGAVRTQGRVQAVRRRERKPEVDAADGNRPAAQA